MGQVDQAGPWMQDSLAGGKQRISIRPHWKRVPDMTRGHLQGEILGSHQDVQPPQAQQGGWTNLSFLTQQGCRASCTVPRKMSRIHRLAQAAPRQTRGGHRTKEKAARNQDVPPGTHTRC